MTYQFQSAGYTGSRLCRNGTATLAEITAIPPDVIYFTCGWKHNIFFTSSQKWYGCGDNEFNQMGQTTVDTDKITELEHLRDIIPSYFACGDKFTAILSEDGSIYTMGNEYGRNATKRPLNHKIVFIACGTTALVAIPDGTGIYFWETGRSEVRYECPSVTFVDAAAGYRQILALSSDGRVYSWGKGRACGQGSKFTSQIPKPVNIEGSPTIKRVFAYNNTSFLLDVDNFLWAAGINTTGQAGLGPAIQRTNIFMRVPAFTQQIITHVAVGDAMSYVLTAQGRVYSTGDGDDSRLMQEDISPLSVFTQCALLKRTNVCFINAGCSHCIVATGMRGIIPHPILGVVTSMSQHVKQMEVIGKNFVVDVSNAGFQIFGFERGDRVFVAGVGEAVVEGITYANELALRKPDGELTVIEEKSFQSYHMSVRVIERKGAQIERILGRSSIEYTFDRTPSKCARFGFLAGERVSHVMFGLGTVAGVMGGAIWFVWDHDNGEASRCGETDLLFMHTHVSIEESKRSIKRIQIGDNYINSEIAPCDVINEAGFKVGDIVTDGEHTAYIIGSFTHKVVLESVDGDVFMELPTSIVLRRRFDKNSVIVPMLAFGGDVIDVDVACQPDDKLIPLDRILLPSRGFATIVGKSDGMMAVMLDDAFVLNAGVVCIDIDKYILLRRTGSTKKNEYGDIGFRIFNPLQIIPSDMIFLDEKYYLVLGQNLETGEFALMDASSKDIIKKVIHEDDIDVIYRSGVDFKRVDRTLRNLECQFSVSLESFAGRRMKPGDRVVTPKGPATVVGMLVGDVWFQHDRDAGSVCFPPQAVFSPFIIKVTHRLGSDLFVV